MKHYITRLVLIIFYFNMLITKGPGIGGHFNRFEQQKSFNSLSLFDMLLHILDTIDLLKIWVLGEGRDNLSSNTVTGQK